MHFLQLLYILPLLTKHSVYEIFTFIAGSVPTAAKQCYLPHGTAICRTCLANLVAPFIKFRFKLRVEQSVTINTIIEKVQQYYINISSRIAILKVKKLECQKHVNSSKAHTNENILQNSKLYVLHCSSARPPALQWNARFQCWTNCLLRSEIFYKTILASTWFCMTIQHSST